MFTMNKFLQPIMYKIEDAAELEKAWQCLETYEASHPDEMPALEQEKVKAKKEEEDQEDEDDEEDDDEDEEHENVKVEE
jgi:hypothetical protein